MCGRKYLAFILSIVLIFLSLGCPGFGTQNAGTTGTTNTNPASSSTDGYLAISGNVHYINAQGVDLASIIVENLSTNEKIAEQSDYWGNYRINGLSHGNYIVTALKNDNFTTETDTVTVPDNADAVCNFVLKDKIIRANRYKSYPGIVAMKLDFASTKIGPWYVDHVVELHCYGSSATSSDNIPPNFEVYAIPWWAAFPTDSALQSPDFKNEVKNKYTYLTFVATSQGKPAYSTIVGSSAITQILNASVGVIFIDPNGSKQFTITTGPNGPSNGKFVYGVEPTYDY